MRVLAVLAVAGTSCAVLASPRAMAWGDVAHEVICEIAYQELAPEARSAVRGLMALDPGYRTFAKACTWPDDPPRQRLPEHYVNLDRASHALGNRPCPEADACVVSAILGDTRDLVHFEAATERLRLLKSLGHWVEVDGERVGIVILEDVEDIEDGGAPLFDLRLAESARGRGLGAPVLRAFTSHVFTRYPELRRMEGQTRQDNIAMRKVFVRSGWVKEAHYREAWPVDGGEPQASVAYGILRRDWETGTTTPVDFDDLPA